MISADLCSLQRLAVHQVSEDWLFPNYARGKHKIGDVHALEKAARRHSEEETSTVSRSARIVRSLRLEPQPGRDTPGDRVC
jgi:hypothetical protein